MTWLAAWAGGFLLLLLLAVAKNATHPDPDEHWPPGCVFLFAAWPLLLLVVVLVWVFNLDQAARRWRRRR